MKEFARAVAYYSRMALGLAAYQLSPRQRDPVAAIRDQMEHRSERFLMTAHWALSRPENLYRKLCDAAGCSYADLEATVRRDGIARATQQLLDAGVFLRHSEFRGREPVIRSGREIHWKPSDLASPWGRSLVEQSTSGSSANRLTSPLGRRLMLYREGYEVLNANEFDLWSRPRVLISSILPSVWPFRYMLACDRIGMPIDHWFTLGGLSTAAHYAMATRFLIEELRLLGAKLPRPRALSSNDFTEIARLLDRFRSEGRPGFLRGVVSPITRIASAARDQGLNLEGTIVSVAGEALTDAKREIIESTGARVYPQYQSSEIGAAGFACRHMTAGNCVHVFEDALSFLAQPLPLGHNALYATSLLPWAPRVLINVEVDDSAVIEKSTCGCEFGRLGFGLQMHDIFSYGKVTGQGMTMQAADLLHVLEVKLPRQFGGAPGDFQLAEVEGDAQTQMLLRVSPRVGITSLDSVRMYFLEQIATLQGGHLSTRVWSFTRGLRVVIQEPETTFTGKTHAIRLRGPGTDSVEQTHSLRQSVSPAESSRTPDGPV
jgi:hypothetical protein